MQQETALRILESGRNTFLAGAPGTGKTYTLNRFVNHAVAQGRNVAVTAGTAVAAAHLDGLTFQSWSGLIGDEYLTPQRVRRIRFTAGDRIEATQILVIDEASTINARTFDLVDRICRIIRRDDRPFGGIQVVASGDFCQLTPFMDSTDKSLPSDEYEKDTRRYLLAGRNPKKSITESFAWEDMQPAVCYLTEQHRQKTDQLLHALTNIREGRVLDSDLRAIARRIAHEPAAGTPAVHVFTDIQDAIRMNNAKLAELTTEPRRYDAKPSGNRIFAENMMLHMRAPRHLTLKEGATVMAVRNDPERRYANGSIGTVEGFADGYPTVRFADGRTATIRPTVLERKRGHETLASVSQLPLQCAWGVTVPDVQGMTLENAVIDLMFPRRHMGYTALSRVRGLEELHLSCLYGRITDFVSPEATRLDGMLRDRSKQAECEFQRSPYKDVD